MRFETAYGYYGITPAVLGDGYCLFKSTTHKGYAMEIGTGAIIYTEGMELRHENTSEEVSNIYATVLVNGMEIVEAPSVLAKVKAHRLAHLNPDAVVELKYPQYTTRVMFPHHSEFVDRFINGKEKLITKPNRELSVPLTILLAQRD